MRNRVNAYSILLGLGLVTFALVAPIAMVDVHRPDLAVLASLFGIAGAYMLLLQVRAFGVALAARSRRRRAPRIALLLAR
ncbi:hypothetical protein [Frondihabitans australicus]|uniref:Uncharacterized protein n=1 Tax=Frondihabitans australicus TaxID=386892 RepID=A0A495IFF1_9MICO|nr:hypothetical protein [Frondihabitans australicus]RKR74742.1 hypothetical protein C8E83_1871 [Frondihabitans australicus]